MTIRRTTSILTAVAAAAASLTIGLTAPSASSAAAHATSNCGGYSNVVLANAKTQDDGKITLYNLCGTRQRVGVGFNTGGQLYTTLCGGRSKTLSLPWESSYYRRGAYVTSVWSEAAGSC
ncbi:hypothetical protein ACFV1N_39555 [Streptosporangium canum]|uniref:hypothetical protein n=1 Tax=Streptosporangium canum TaxID=324952 RepID=UPI00367B98DE